MQPSEMASLSNSSWQTRKERQNQSTNNGYMAAIAKRYVVFESVSDTLVRHNHIEIKYKI